MRNSYTGGSRRSSDFMAGDYPHDVEGRDPPKYGETRREYLTRISPSLRVQGLRKKDDGRIFRGWVKNGSGNYREQWLTPESWAGLNKRRSELGKENRARNREALNADRAARRRGDPHREPKLSIQSHGMSADEWEALTPEQQKLMRELDAAGRE